MKDFTLLLIVLFFVSLSTSVLLAEISGRSHVGLDLAKGVQKFHKNPTSRLGGVGIVLGLTVFISMGTTLNVSYTNFSLILFLSSLPIFTGGLLEDLTHSVTPTVRLILAVLSANCFWFLTQSGVERTGVAPIDWLLHWPLISYLLTLLVITGFTHSVNIIDGFNGLASGQILLMLVFLALISFGVGETELGNYCCALTAVTMGFILLNWPYGRIFLGDSGSYLLGCSVVFIGLTLVHRLPNLSAFTPIMLGLYPLVEALFSIYRRVIIRQVSMNNPDALHLHSLIYRRLILKKTSHKLIIASFKNSMVSLYFLIIVFFFDLLTYIFRENSHILFLLFFVFILMYILLYKSLITFKTPKILFNFHIF